MKILKLLLLISALLINTTAYAHTGLKSSIPEDKAVLKQAPDTVTLEFHSAVHLLKLQLVNDKDEELKLDFQPKSEAAARFSQPLPGLKAGNYTVKWISMGKDTHKISGEFSFELNTGDQAPETQTDPCPKDSAS